MSKILRVAFDNLKKNFQLENSNNFYYGFGYTPKTNKNVINCNNNNDIFYYGFGYMPIQNKQNIKMCNNFGHVKLNNK